MVLALLSSIQENIKKLDYEELLTFLKTFTREIQFDEVFLVRFYYNL